MKYKATLLLAREMVRLEAAVKEAAKRHEWAEAEALEEARWEAQQQRSRLMRRQWALERKVA